MKTDLPNDDRLLLSAGLVSAWPPTIPSPHRPCATPITNPHEVGVSTLKDLRSIR